jgi:hypothetical protein
MGAVLFAAGSIAHPSLNKPSFKLVIPTPWLSVVLQVIPYVVTNRYSRDLELKGQARWPNSRIGQGRLRLGIVKVILRMDCCGRTNSRTYP